MFLDLIVKFDDVIGVILSEETHRKTPGGSTLGSSLNAQSRGRMTKRGSNSRNRGKSRGKSNGRRSQSRGQEIFDIVRNQGIRRNIARLERTMKEINQKGIMRPMW